MFKRLNSHVVSSIVMIFFEIITLLENPLFEFILTLGIHSGRVVWYCSWILFSLIAVWILDYFHKRLSLVKSISFKLIRIAFLTTVAFNIIDCIDRYTINHEMTWFIILFAKSTIQIGFVIALFIGLFKHDETLINIPHAAHNRSVNWFQSLQGMPPLQRARELEKWEAFTKNLPTDKNLTDLSSSSNYRF